MADIIDIPKIPGTYHGNKVRHRDRYKFIRRARVHFLVSLLVACVALPLTASVLAQSSISSMTAEPSEGAMMSMPMRADGHVPLGVTGGDFMTKGNWMISYRYMRMEMDNNLIGTDSVSPEQIISTVSNRFFGLTGQPSTLRVVPTNMTTNMHMFGLMYAPTQSLTVVSMIPYLDRSMKHVTFEGPSGNARLGTFTTTSSGIGDVKLMSLYRAWAASDHRIHLNAGLSLPTGSIDEEGAVLTPGGGRPTLRLPYPMQLGSGTFDLMPGATYKGQSDRIGWGAQYLATIRLGDNDEGYTLGDVHRITG